MAIDLGDPHPLSVLVTDDQGAPANAGAVTVTVTLPDLSVASPVVTNPTVGIYTASFPTTLAGRHLVRWLATGVNSSAYTDEFDVSPIDPGMLISLEQARKGLGVASGNIVNDEDLRDAILAAAPIMEDLCGPILAKPRVETYDGGASQINLLYAPLISVTAITESYGSNYQRALTVQDIFGASVSDSYGYSVDLVTGIVTRRASGVAVGFAAGRRNVQVSYVSGRAVISANILRATRLLVRQLWILGGQQGFRPNMGAANTSMGKTPSGFAVPNAVVEMLGGADTRPPGLA